MDRNGDLKIQIADSSGNVTAFVHTPAEREDYAGIASHILEMGNTGAEQVGFIKNLTAGENLPEMEMCGLEFCGNATRAFALMSALASGMKGECTVKVRVSGCGEPLDVCVNTETGWAGLRMPGISGIYTETIAGKELTVADLGGIMHVIAENETASDESFCIYREYINNKYNPPAMGVMYTGPEENKMTPVVYVRDVDSTYYEGSCATGSTAYAAVRALSEGNGMHRFEIRQPAGTITATCKIYDGTVLEIYIEGPVTLQGETVLSKPSENTPTSKPPGVSGEMNR